MIKKVTRAVFYTILTFQKCLAELKRGISRKSLDLIPGGKGVIPYEHIKTFDSLDSVPDNRNFLLRINFIAN